MNHHVGAAVVVELKDLAGAALGHPRASEEVCKPLPGGPWQPHGPCNYMIKAEKEKI